MRWQSFTGFIWKLEHARLSHCSSTYTIFMCHIRCEPPPLSLTVNNSYKIIAKQINNTLKISALKHGCCFGWLIRLLRYAMKTENPHRKMLSVQICIDHFRGSFYGRCDNFFLPHSYTHTQLDSVHLGIFYESTKLLYISCVRAQMTLKSHNICLRNAINPEKSLNEIGLKFLFFRRKLKKKLWRRMHERKKVKTETSIKMKCCVDKCAYVGHIRMT